MSTHTIRRHSVTIDKEKRILRFLYDEGPHSGDEVAAHFGMKRDSTLKQLNGMHAAGLVDRSRLRSGNSTVYWIYLNGIDEENI